MTEAAHQRVGPKTTPKPKLRDGGPETTGLRAVAAELRTQALEIKRNSLITAGSIYGVVVETAYDDRVTSLIVLADGSTSWYVDNGHGCIGCDRDDEVRVAAQQFIGRASALQTYCADAVDRLQPQPGRMRLFLMTDSGLMSIQEDLDIASRASAPNAQPHVASLVDVYTAAQRLLQLIERRDAGTSLEHEVVALFAEMPVVEQLSTTEPSEKTSETKECLSVGNAVRRLRT